MNHPHVSSSPEGFRLNRSAWSWILYDWANSAFALTVLAAFFPIFFHQYWSHGEPSTAKLGFGNAAAGLLVAILSPFLGALGDAAGRRKAFLVFFMLLGAGMTATLYLVPQNAWMAALVVFGIAVVGFSSANLFYDSLLPEVAPASEYGRISSLGYGIGYLGCALLFILNMVMVQQPALFGLRDPGHAVRAAFLSVSAWWILFSVPLMLFVPESKALRTKNLSASLRSVIPELKSTFASIRSRPGLLTFLIAYWLYIDGVHTFIRMAADLGKSIGLANADLMRALLFVQLAAFPAALVFGRISKSIGERRSILIGIGIYVFITISAPLTVDGPRAYTFFAVLSALPQGCLQALSRSYFARIIPSEKAAEYFGFYNLMGKFAVFFGPLMIAVVVLCCQAAGVPSLLSSRYGFASTSLLFILGGIVLAIADRKTVPAIEKG